jgi:hypothetical protein
MNTSPYSPAARRMLVLASVLILSHGLIEVLSLVWLFLPTSFHFAFEELNQSWQATMVVGVVMGLMRITAAAGLFMNQMWAWVLGLLLSVITITMLTLYLPAGATDSILAGGALVLLVVGKFHGVTVMCAKDDIRKMS